MALGLGLAVLVGLALGLLGGGGSILAVPIFVYVLGYGAKEAIAMSLAVVGVTSGFGAVRHWRLGNVDARVAVIFGAVAMGGTYLGARLAAYVSDQFQLTLFAGVMAVSAVFMFRESLPFADRLSRAMGGKGHGGAGGEESDPGMPMPLIVAEGIGVGVLTGMVGVGGGFLIVPALVLLGGISMNKAVGTSLLVIAMKSAAGFVGYLGQVEVPWLFMGWFSAAAVVGILGGASLVRHVPQAALRRAFAGFLVVMASFILYENRAVFTGGSGPGGRDLTATTSEVVTPGAGQDVASATTARDERALPDEEAGAQRTKPLRGRGPGVEDHR